jgi:hypothetical protein
MRIACVLLLVCLGTTACFLRDHARPLTNMESDLGIRFDSYQSGSGLHRWMHADCPKERLLSTPEWTEGEANPPLDARNAIKLSATELLQYVEHPKAWEIRKVFLERYGRGNSWFYRIVWMKVRTDDGDHPLAGASMGEEFRIIVLMDGSVLHYKTEALFP